MVHSGGFEPPTARFVAEYSIQLSYECRLALLTQSPLGSALLEPMAPALSDMVHSGGFEPPTARFVAEYSIQLSYECKLALLTQPPLGSALLEPMAPALLKWCTQEDSNLRPLGS